MKVTSERDFQATTGEFASGRLILSMDGQPRRKLTVANGAAVFPIPRGEHAVELGVEGR